MKGRKDAAGGAMRQRAAFGEHGGFVGRRGSVNEVAAHGGVIGRSGAARENATLSRRRGFESGGERYMCHVIRSTVKTAARSDENDQNRTQGMNCTGLKS